MDVRCFAANLQRKRRGMDLTPATMRIVEDGPVVRVTFDNGAVNLFDPTMIEEFRTLLAQLASRTDLSVIVFDSANPDFFIGHADLNLFLAPVQTLAPKPTRLSMLQQVFEDLRTLPQATIAVVAGRATGAGAEFVTSCDMAFAVRGQAVFSQFEVAVGVLPGATGSQRLPKLMGRSRALEMILGCDDFDADLAAEYGLVNRAVDASDIRGFVDNLVARLASFPPAAIAQNKIAVDASELPMALGLLEESYALAHTLVGGEGQRRMRKLLELGAQQADFERERFTASLVQLG
jgi:enoyl-CoA hydratase/carnithine racemase